MRMRGTSVYLAAMLTVVGCDDDDTQPESVPFEGLDPAVQPKIPEPAKTPEPEPSATAEPKPAPKTNFKMGRLSSCCAALAAVGRTSPDPSQRSSAKSSSRVCVTKMSEVKQGKLTTEAALSQVRSSILGTAPGACR